MNNSEFCNSNQGLIFDIQRFCVHDGPGIRDLVFVKGCPLHCQWCSNPESQCRNPEIGFNESRCIGWRNCGRCLNICPVGAIKCTAGPSVIIDRKLCTNCGKCAEICPSRAIRLYGECKSVDEIVKIIEEDEPFYRRSGGGITVSGGEPLIQADFVAELLNKSRERGIHTAIETTGLAKWEDLKKVCRNAKLILYDIKLIDPKEHLACTGVSNEAILENLKKLAGALPDTPVTVRTPIIPGFTDSENNIRAIADFVSSLDNVKNYELLPYHRFGESKYHQLGREYALSDVRSPTPEKMAILRKIAEQCCKKR